jgi:hypothetical protein
MREWVVLVETDPLDGLTYSIVEYVIIYYPLLRKLSLTFTTLVLYTYPVSIDYYLSTKTNY